MPHIKLEYTDISDGDKLNKLLDLNEKKQFSIEIRETNFNNYY